MNDETTATEAINELLREVDTNTCVKHLEEMWESWITNERNDFSEAEKRACLLSSYKNIRKLLQSIDG